jgi:hypothetical protein
VPRVDSIRPPTRWCSGLLGFALDGAALNAIALQTIRDGLDRSDVKPHDTSPTAGFDMGPRVGRDRQSQRRLARTGIGNADVPFALR